MTRNKQIVLGVVPAFDEGKLFLSDTGIERQYVRRDYTKTIAAVGAVPIILNPDMPLSYIMGLCDGIVISGGADIAPSHYGQKRLPSVKVIEPKNRFSWEKKLIQSCDKYRVPILGICYGMQRLNVHYGGTLIQDILSFFPDNIGHVKQQHEVRFITDFLGLRSMQVHNVNSRHHQSLGRIAEGFRVVGETSDGVVEAIEGRGHYGIQWHPESDETGAHIYRAFAELCVGDQAI